MKGVTLKTRLKNAATDVGCEIYCARSRSEAKRDVRKAFRDADKAERKAKRDERRAAGDIKETSKQTNASENNVAITTTEESKAKTLEEIMAEAEAPVEEVGVEKIDPAEANNEPKPTIQAGVVVEAAMQNPPAPKDEAKLNLGFGVVMDLGAMSNSSTPSVIQAPQQTPIQQPIPQPQQVVNPNNMIYMPNIPPQQNMPPIYPQQPIVIPPVQQHVMTAQQPPMPPRHKVDNPQPEKPKPEKAKPDDVNIDLSNIDVPVNPPKPPREWPEVVADPLPQAGHVEPEEVTPKFDNSEITSKLKYMKEIERVALATNHQVQMIPQAGRDGQPNGLIRCIVYNEGSSKPNPYKGFTIDTGAIIDRRVKMFPAILATGYENYQAYAVMVPRPKPEGKGNKNMFNEQLFVDMFTGGAQMLDERNGMYTPDYRDLNKLVAMVTVPTQHMNGDTRKHIRDRLFAAKRSGVFDAALKIDPGSRFRFVDFNKKDMTFKLSNEGVPKFFGTPPVSIIPIEIDFGKDTCTLNYPKNIPPVG